MKNKQIKETIDASDVSNEIPECSGTTLLIADQTLSETVKKPTVLKRKRRADSSEKEPALKKTCHTDLTRTNEKSPLYKDQSTQTDPQRSLFKRLFMVPKRRTKKRSWIKMIFMVKKIKTEKKLQEGGNKA